MVYKIIREALNRLCCLKFFPISRKNILKKKKEEIPNNILDIKNNSSDKDNAAKNRTNPNANNQNLCPICFIK